MASKPFKNRATAAAKPAVAVAREAAPKSSAGNLAAWLFPAYALMLFAGYMLLRTPGAMVNGQEMGGRRALFTAVNAATLTGFGQITDIDKYPAAGQAIMFGMIVCGSLFSLVIGGSAVAKILRLGYSEGRILRAAALAEAAAIVAGTFLLLFDKDRTVNQSAFIAASAFGNAGLILGPSVNGWQTHFVLIPLMIAGGLGICVLIELFDLWRKRIRSLSEHARAAMAWTAWIYIGGTIVLVLLGYWAGAIPADDTVSGSAWRDLIGSSAAATAASRTAGMGLVALEHLSRPSLWFLMLLMVVGGSAGSTAGGVKATTFVEIFRGVGRALRGEQCGRGFGIAAVWLGGFLLLVFCALLLLLHNLPQMPPEKVLFLVISAASNVGLSQAPLNPDPIVAYVLSATMLLGRFGPLMVLWWMADTTTDATIAIG